MVKLKLLAMSGVPRLATQLVCSHNSYYIVTTHLLLTCLSVAVMIAITHNAVQLTNFLASENQLFLSLAVYSEHSTLQARRTCS